MDERVERKMYSLEEAVSKVVDESRTLAAWVDGGYDLTEDLQQIVVALHYEVETLKAKLTLATLSGSPK